MEAETTPVGTHGLCVRPRQRLRYQAVRKIGYTFRRLTTDAQTVRPYKSLHVPCVRTAGFTVDAVGGVKKSEPTHTMVDRLRHWFYYRSNSRASRGKLTS